MKNGPEDSYSFACSIAALLYCPECAAADSDACLRNPELPRTDPTALEYVLWKMTRRRYRDRLHATPTMLTMLAAVTHM